jgi:hypothetical protein
LRLELLILQNIADDGCPEGVFVQAQRCIMLARALPNSPLVLDGALETFRYSHETFCQFLELLRSSLVTKHTEIFPAVLKIDGAAYTRLEGEFSENQESGFWSWTPPVEGHFANGLVVYLPRAIPRTLPVTMYGRHTEDRRGFSVAREAKSVSGPGVAIVLENLRGKLTETYLAANADTMHQRLRNALGDGHAIYKF